MSLEIERQSYDTHHNYIRCLCRLVHGTILNATQTLNKAPIPLIDTKNNLVALTKRSLRDEFDIVQIDNDYSYASTSWLPVKSYYLVFNTLLSIEYTYKIQSNNFIMSHTGCIEEFSRKLRDGEIVFSQPILNQVFDQSILSYKTTTGANLSGRTPEDEMYKLAIRKIAKYKVDDFKRSGRLNLKRKAHKIQLHAYLETFKVSIFDFPYFMRIRANYRDFAFIEGISATETANYFNTYYNFTQEFVRSLEGLRDANIVART